jgi:DNA-directed RNA polymerase subunit M/transcription elongation factor TFIIS
MMSEEHPMLDCPECGETMTPDDNGFVCEDCGYAE